MFYCLNISASGSTEYSRFTPVSMLLLPTSWRHDVGSALGKQPEPVACCIAAPSGAWNALE
jgi:hypothetical protein